MNTTNIHIFWEVGLFKYDLWYQLLYDIVLLNEKIKSLKYLWTPQKYSYFEIEDYLNMISGKQLLYDIVLLNENIRSSKDLWTPQTYTYFENWTVYRLWYLTGMKVLEAQKIYDIAKIHIFWEGGLCI